MQIARTFDESFIYDCLMSAWVPSTDDGSPSKELSFPLMEESNYWLEVKDQEITMGVFLFSPQNFVCYEIHSMLLPASRGKGVACGKVAADWIFSNTPCSRVVASIPSFNKIAAAAAKRGGMKQFGINENSFLKNGVLYDQTLFGITKKI